MDEFDPKQYWERRLSADGTITGVGYRRLGRSFNEWAYRVRRDRFVATIREQDLDLAGARVLDVGSGTGFYISCWQDLGAGSIVGSDLAEAAVARLRQRFPAIPFVQLDIGGDLPADLSTCRFDVVDAMDVLFHIIDQKRFTRALQNVHRLLEPGGLFVWTDGFIHSRPFRREHILIRTLSEIEQALDDTGFQIVKRAPMYQFMNAPVDTEHRTAMLGWLAAASVISLWDGFGNLAGRALYRLETRLAETRTESPTMEIMVCRRR